MDNLLDFIGELYEASLDPSRWDNVIANLCRLVGARSGCLNVEDHVLRQRFMIAGHGMPRATKLTYRLGLAKHDHTFRIQASRPVGEAAMVARHDEVQHSNPLYYRLIMKPFNMGYIAAINLFNDDEWHAGIGIQRSFDAAPFEEPELRLLDSLAPHFQRALRIQREFHRLKSRAESLRGALSRLVTGIIVLDRQQNIVYRNEACETILRRHPALQLNRNRIRAHDPFEQQQLRDLVSRLLASPPRDVDAHNQAIALHHPDRAKPLMLILTAVAEDPHGTGPDTAAGRVTVHVIDPESTLSMPADTLHSLYGLTPAEASVAILLANGLSTGEIAARNAVSQETVRSQLKSIYSKMEARNQQDVIRLLLRLGTAMATKPA